MINQKPNIPTVLVIFGATGDLMVKKIVPALFHLFVKEKLPKMFKVIGVARRPLTDEEFKNHIGKILLKHHVEENNPRVKDFFKYFFYHQGKFENIEDYNRLAKDMGRIDDEWKVCSNKLFYLAVPPSYNEQIFNNLHDSGLTIPCSPEEGWTRVIVEKPFGRDLETAEKLDMLLSKLFKEEQIYRIDHYLAKEMLQNILSFRFSNNLLEESWSNKFIEKIEIRVLEKIGVEDRGAFYDGVGALRDVGQNHLLQMLALVTMEHPKNFTSATIRRKRAEILEKLRSPDEDEIKNFTYRAQYEGYQQIKGVDSKSQTETYFKTRAFLDSPRWHGVPISLESGKRFEEAVKDITITFKHTSPCLCPPGVSKHFKNVVKISIEPDEKITINFLAKKPGLEIQVESRALEFTYRERTARTQYVEEYEKLLMDCIEGNQLLFLSTEEIREMWKYTDPIIHAWEKNLVPLKTYNPGVKEIQIPEIKDQSAKTILNNKQVGILGLGKMGTNLAKRLLEKNWKVVGYNRTPEVTKNLEKEGLDGTYSIKELVSKLDAPRVVYLLLPAGGPTQKIVQELPEYLEKGDIIIESSNSFYKETIKLGREIKKQAVEFIDVGVSGGPGGARNGACLMIGGDKKTFDYLHPLFVDMAVTGGVEHFEGVGAGHFVKTIHNGIEYGMMQAIAEGFSIMKKSDYNLDLKRVADIYNHGSVIESRLTAWIREGFEKYGVELDSLSGSAGSGGAAGMKSSEGKWTVDIANELNIPARVIEESVKARLESQVKPNYQGKIINVLRNMFGGHKAT